MSVYDITLADPTQPERPAERLLRVCAVGDLVFVSIDTCDDGNPTLTLTTQEEITVSLPALRQALQLLSDDGHREGLRGKDERGEPLPDLVGQRQIVVPL